jgi:hypothetical protein
MWGLDINQLEELWMMQHELTDLYHLLAAPTNVVIFHIGQICLFVFPFDQIAICGDAYG